MVRLYLVRHGWTAWHSEHRVAGWSDVPLDARGQAEAQATGRWLAGRVDAAMPLIVSSPVTRALQTAELITGCLPAHPEVLPDERLADTRVGHWEGMLVSEIEASEPLWPEFFRSPARFRFPGGESLEDVQRRSVAAVESLAAAGTQRGVVVVAHADPLRCIIAHYLGLSLDHAYRMRLGCGSVSRLSLPLENIDGHGNWPRLDFLNMTEHLPAMEQGDSS